MAWNLNDAAKIALLNGAPAVGTTKIASTISFGDGDGTGATDTINDSGSGLVSAGFAVGDYIMVIGGTNTNKLVKALTVAAGKIEVVAGSFATASAGSPVCLVEISGGSLAQVFKNMSIDGYSGTRPANANLTESGTKLIQFSLNGNAFVAGTSTNGLNFGNMSGTTLQFAVDPATGVAEVCRGVGITPGGTLGYVRVYANDKTTGASTSTPRMDGVAATSGGDFNISTGTTIVTGVPVEVTGVSFTVA